MSDLQAVSNSGLVNQYIEDDFSLLSLHDDSNEVEVSQTPDALGTISAGFMSDKGIPQVSRDGTIHLHDPEGICPYLASVLKANPKRLVVTPAFDDFSKCIQQTFRRYSKSRLEVYGNKNEITEIVVKGKDAEHVTHKAGTPEYKSLKESCKVNTSFYFFLADWNDDGTSRIILNDGAGFYRLRTTSTQGAQNIVSQLQNIKRYTQGRVAGVPLDLFHTMKEKADPTGAKRNVPIWQLVRHPHDKVHQVCTSTLSLCLLAARGRNQVL